MAHYVRLISFTPEGKKDIRKYREGRREFLDAAGRLGVKVIAEYVTLGEIDVVTILEAPDNSTILKLSAQLGSTGRTNVRTLGAVPAEEFEKIADSI
ncbi:MAG: GYD domain-containing protein [Nitrososphaerales archaeon]